MANTTPWFQDHTTLLPTQQIKPSQPPLLSEWEARLQGNSWGTMLRSGDSDSVALWFWLGTRRREVATSGVDSIDYACSSQERRCSATVGRCGLELPYKIRLFARFSQAFASGSLRSMGFRIPKIRVLVPRATFSARLRTSGTKGTRREPVASWTSNGNFFDRVESDAICVLIHRCSLGSRTPGADLP